MIERSKLSFDGSLTGTNGPPIAAGVSSLSPSWLRHAAHEVRLALVAVFHLVQRQRLPLFDPIERCLDPSETSR